MNKNDQSLMFCNAQVTSGGSKIFCWFSTFNQCLVDISVLQINLIYQANFSNGKGNIWYFGLYIYIHEF